MPKLKDNPPTDQAIDRLFIRCLARKATPDEQKALQALFVEGSDRKVVFDDIFWSLLNSREFVFNH